MTINEHERKFQKRKENLDECRDEGDISETDYQAIQDFVEYDLTENKKGTVANHIIHLRTIAERSDKPITELATQEVNDLIRSFKNGTHPDVKDEGIIINNHLSVMRNFYRYHDHLQPDPDDIDVEEEYSGRDLSPEDLLYAEEVDKYLAAAQRENVRDMAVIAITLAIGQRIDAVRTLRMKHVHEDGQTMEITLNEEEGSLKGAKGSRPLLWAKHYVRQWLDAHPHKDDPEAALFPPTKSSESGSMYKKKPMADRGFRRIYRKRAENAGIEKDVYPHLLRHSAITRMAAQGDLSEQQIKSIVGWSPDSSQFSIYVHLADDIMTDSVRESKGIPTSDREIPAVGRPSLKRCPNCNDEIPENAERCRTCRTALTHSEAIKGDERKKAQESVDDALWESQKQASEQQKNDLDTVRQIVKENPQAVFEALEETGAMDALAEKLADNLD